MSVMSMKSIKNDSEEKLANAEQKIKELKKIIQSKDTQIEESKKTINQLTSENADLQKKLVKAINKIKVYYLLNISNS